MGNIASSNPSSTSVTNKRYTTQDIARNIETLLRASTVKDMSIASDTMKFKRSDNFSAGNVNTLESLSDLNLSSISGLRGGSNETVLRNVPSRDRYSQFDKQSGGNVKQFSATSYSATSNDRQSGGNVKQFSATSYSATSNDYRTISDVDLTMLKDMILKNQDGGCPCNDDGLSATSHLVEQKSSKHQSGGCSRSDDKFSATSSQPIDYSVLKGGAKKDKKKDKKKKESESEDDEDEDDDEEDLTLDDDDDEDDDDEDYDEDDGDELSRTKESSSTSDTSSSESSSSSSSNSDLSRVNHNRYGDYAVTTESEKKFVVDAKQFYSSESGDVYGNDSMYLKNNRAKSRLR
jgi:hypothetical protein